jgi:hypothetical protein
MLTDRVSVWGTQYKVGQLIVTEVVCQDILEVGVIESIVVRGNMVLFLVFLHACARDSLNIFHSVPKNKIRLVDYCDLPDFKPLIRRGQGKSFLFMLHHYLPLLDLPL